MTAGGLGRPSSQGCAAAAPVKGSLQWQGRGLDAPGAPRCRPQRRPSSCPSAGQVPPSPPGRSVTVGQLPVKPGAGQGPACHWQDLGHSVAVMKLKLAFPGPTCHRAARA
jgi:hypothetical protein